MSQTLYGGVGGGSNARIMLAAKRENLRVESIYYRPRSDRYLSGRSDFSRCYCTRDFVDALTLKFFSRRSIDFRQMECRVFFYIMRLLFSCKYLNLYVDVYNVAREFLRSLYIFRYTHVDRKILPNTYIFILKKRLIHREIFVCPTNDYTTSSKFEVPIASVAHQTRIFPFCKIS